MSNNFCGMGIVSIFVQVKYTNKKTTIMKNSILKSAFIALLTLTLASCAQKNSLAPQVANATETRIANMPPIIIADPIFDSITIDYVINIVSVDTTKVTNLVNGLGYTYKNQSGNWVRVVKYAYDGCFKKVQKGEVIRGRFKVRESLDNINFQSNLFLLSTNMGDPAINSQNIATLQVYEDGVLIVDKSPSGTPTNNFYWTAPYQFDISVLTPLHR